MTVKGVLLLALCGLLAYVTALANPFAFDDVYVVRDNLLLQTTDGLRQFWSGPGLTGGPVLAFHYRPLTMTTLWLDRQLLGGSVVSYRTTNLLLHIACACLLGALARRLLQHLDLRERPGDRRRRMLTRQAFLAAAVFVVHPLFSEAVEQIFKRTSSLCALLMLGSLVVFDRAFGNGRLRVGLVVAGVLLSWLAMLAKESAAVMPALLALYGLTVGWWPSRRKPLLASVLACAVFPLGFALFFFPDGAVPSQPHAGLRHLLAQPGVLLEYGLMWVAPQRVPIAMGVPPASWPPQMGSVLGVLTLAGVLLWSALRLRGWPLLRFALWWGALCLSPTSSVVAMHLVGDPIRMYLASFGVLVLVGRGLGLLWELVEERLPPSLARAGGLVGSLPAVGLLLWLTGGTLQTSERHADVVASWRHAAALYPRDSLLHANLCGAETDSAHAVEVCRRALALDPDSVWVRLRLVTALAQMDQQRAAEEELAAARAQLGDSWQLWLAEARMAWVAQQLPRAHDAFLQVLRENPNQLEARVYLADVRLRLGIPDAAPLVAPIGGSAGGPVVQAMLSSVRSRLSQQPRGHPP